MFESIRFLVSYSAVRVTLYVVLILVFALFFARVLMKKRIAVRVLSVAAVAAFVLATAFVPVENAVVRFGTPEDAVRYSLPNQKVLKVLEHGEWATVVCKDKRTVVLQKDAGGWKAANPAFVGWGVRWGFIENVGYQTRQLSNGVYFIGVNTRRYVDESGNKGAILIDTITDTNGSAFGLFETDILDKSETVYATDSYYYAFVESLGDGYHLVINGEDRPFE